MWSKKKETLGMNVIYTSVLVTLATMVAVVTVVHAQRGDARHLQEKGQTVATGVSTVALLLWPLVFNALVGFNTLKTSPVLLIAYLWTVALIAWEILTSNRDWETPEEADQRSSSTKMNANVLIGAAWAVGSLLTVVSRSSKQSEHGARILLVALVLCVAFVIPMMVDIDLRSPVAKTMRGLQRTALQYSVGLFVAGITISWLH